MFLDKKGVKILAVYWFAILVLISAGVFSMVYSFQVPYDVRGMETGILSGKIAGCLAPQGILDSEFTDLNSGLNYDSVEKTNPNELNSAIDYAGENSVGERRCNCGDSCESYAKWILENSEENNIFDPLILVSIMMQESSCNSEASSGSSVGLMQINLEVHCGSKGLPEDKDECRNELLNNPEKNIEVGSIILRNSYDDVIENFGGERQFSGACTEEYKQKTYSGWEAALRGYVGWGCAEGHDDYVEGVINRYNELREILGKQSLSEEPLFDLESKCNLTFNQLNNDATQYYTAVEIINISSGDSKIIRDGNINLAKDCEIQKDEEHKLLSKCSESNFYSVDKKNNQYLIKILSAVRKSEKNVR